MRAYITDIKNFAVHDGDGIRTTVFFKGCPLSCVWCHNPETILNRTQLAYYVHKCIGCGSCASICQCHSIRGGKHSFQRENCVACGKCVEKCLVNALELCGKEVDCEEICKILLEDRDFYKTSGGGITLSGGECLLQAEACREILFRMKQEGIHTAIDTCGMVPWENIKKVIDYTDVFLYDIKAIDEEVHKQCTGASNQLILDNLKKIGDYGKQIEIRIPYVPDYNDGEMEKIAEFLSGINHITKVKILAYHNLAASKYGALGMNDNLPKEIPSSEMLEKARGVFRKRDFICNE